MCRLWLNIYTFKKIINFLKLKRNRFISNGGDMMNDLKKIEKKFHEFLKIGLDEEFFDFNQIKIDEESLNEGKRFFVPFGFAEYFLVIEDEKPIVYFNIATRMDTDTICFVGEDSYDCYDVFMGEHIEIIEKYFKHRKKLKFNRELKDIRKNK